MILWARSSDRRNDRIWHLASAALFAASALVLASAVQSSLLLLLALGSAAIGVYSGLPLGNTLVPSFLSGAALASGFALMNMISNLLGGFAGQYLIGLIREKTGSYVPALVPIATALVVYATIVLLLGRSIQPRRTAMLKPST
jgi:ACS family tartrate transporter-like MFS transporter